MGGGTEHGRRGMEAAAQRARTDVEAAWMGLGGAVLELNDQRLGAAGSGWRGRPRWRRSSSVGGGLEARALASVRSSGLASAARRPDQALSGRWVALDKLLAGGIIRDKGRRPGQPIGARRAAMESLPSRSHSSAEKNLKETPKPGFQRKKNR
jgi:hypothetical protein